MNANILIAGDYHIYGKYDQFIKKNVDHKIFTDQFKCLSMSHDFRVFNLEDPVSSSRDFCIKSGPIGVGSPESLVPIRDVAFNLATFATNHTYDVKDKGIIDTIDFCNAAHIDIVGAGLEKEEVRQPLRTVINGVNISFLNYARREFNCVNGKHGGANPFDLINAYHDVVREKLTSDTVIVIIHDGVDLYELPSPETVKQMRFLAEAGPDLIVMHHSQKYSGYETFKGVPIFYGLGNLLHLSDNEFDAIGLMLSVTISKSLPLEIGLIPIKLNKAEMMVDLLAGQEKKTVLSEVEELSKIITSDLLLEQKWMQFLQSKRLSYLFPLMGMNRIVYKILKKTSLLSVVDRMAKLKLYKLLPVLNIMRCSVHREAAIRILEDLYE